MSGESHAIVRYLAAAYGAGTLWPIGSDGSGLWPINGADWAATTFLRAAWLCGFLRRSSARRSRSTMPPAIARARAEANRLYAMVDKRLGRHRDFLGGEQLRLLPILPSGVSMFRWMTMDIRRPPMPAILEALVPAV